jgi:hypothetical protein
MLSEDIEQKEEKKPPRKETPVPFYFDKYVECEFRALRQRINNLIDDDLKNLKESVDRRFADLKKSIDERFVRVDERIDNLKKSL